MTNRKISYTKLGIMSAIIFLVIIILMNFLMSLTSKNAVDVIIDNMLTPKFLGSRIIMAIFYGLFMVYLFKRKEKKFLKK